MMPRGFAADDGDTISRRLRELQDARMAAITGTCSCPRDCYGAALHADPCPLKLVPVPATGTGS